MENFINAVVKDLATLESLLEGVNTNGKESVGRLNHAFRMIGQMQNGLNALIKPAQPQIETENLEEGKGE